jgi:hypothetical protein
MRFIVLLVPILLIFSQASGQDLPAGERVVPSVVKAASAFLETLDAAQRKSVLFSFDDNEQRKRWSNLPTGIFQRKGLRWGDLKNEQRTALMEILKATLSPEGVMQVVENMDGDEILKGGSSAGPGGRGPGGPRGRGPGGLVFGKDEYYFSILGNPSETEPWMWQFGGHHLAVNATIVGDQITLAPSLTGGQPVDYELNGKKVRQLANEEDTAFKLINSLSPDQRKQAILDDHHADMIWGPGKEDCKPRNEGIKVSTFDEAQKKLFLELVGHRIGILNKTHATSQLTKVAGELDQTWFSWFGPIDPGAASSFRIQGPTILIEYAPQHMGGDSTNHTHAMYRDPINDYGTAFIRHRK